MANKRIDEFVPLTFKRNQERYAISKLTSVQDFLRSKELNSQRASKTYLNALVHFSNFLKLKYGDQNAETVIQSIKKGEIDLYNLLNSFVQYISEKVPVTIATYLEGVKSYLEFNDVEISAAKLKRRVTLAKVRKHRAQPTDASDIRQLLIKCHNKRLKINRQGRVRSSSGAIR